MAATPSSGSTTSPVPLRIRVRSASATTRSASSRRRNRSVRQSLASSTDARLRFLEKSFSFPSKRSKSVKASAVASAQNVSSLLDQAQTWFLGLNGAVFEVPRDDLARFERPFERDFVPAAAAKFATLVEAIESAPAQTYLLALHGGEGEDGTVQRM